MTLDELAEFKALIQARESAWKRAADLGIEIALAVRDGDQPSETISEMFSHEWSMFEAADKSLSDHFARRKAVA